MTEKTQIRQLLRNRDYMIGVAEGTPPSSLTLATVFKNCAARAGHGFTATGGPSGLQHITTDENIDLRVVEDILKATARELGVELILGLGTTLRGGKIESLDELRKVSILGCSP